MLKKLITILTLCSCFLGIMGCGSSAGKAQSSSPKEESKVSNSVTNTTNANNNMVLIKGGEFLMGSPESEPWRGKDEVQHKVTVSDFYMSPYELTQKEYQEITGKNPSNFKGENLPVENITWLDAVAYCNARSTKEGLTPVYTLQGNNVTWDKAANGYRLPTEAEWEYACRANTTTPFNTENSISVDESNYYGHYPYQIEENYFNQSKLTTKPGTYRERTVAVNSFKPNKFGLYNMHGNVNEWVWDYYGAYSTAAVTNPTGPEQGSLKVYRGGGWNDFAKNLRSAYRATLPEDKASYNIGLRLVRNAIAGVGSIAGAVSKNISSDKKGKVLLAYFSWGGTTRGIAREIQKQSGADVFEITLVKPYSNDYHEVLKEAQRDQNQQARPQIANRVNNFQDYDVILLGYPNWWASIPMPIASFLEEYDFKGKKIVPFCSHGGGRLGQSLTAISKLAPNVELGEALSIHYGGGSSLDNDIAEWLKQNKVNK